MEGSIRNRATRPASWVALLALLLVALTGTVELRTCSGSCEAAPAAASCCVDADASNDCCGCCESPAERPAPADDEDGDSGCCTTVDFDVDQAPSSAATKFSAPTPEICWIAPLPALATRVYESARPFNFDRGPPRVDERTALRATQVLLI